MQMNGLRISWTITRNLQAAFFFLSVEKSRNVDQYATEKLGIHSLVLMENAGRGAAAAIRDFLFAHPPKSLREEPVITLLIGPGNNGGDGWVIARHLEAWGIKTACYHFGTEERLSADNRANYQIQQRAGSNITYMDKMPRIIAQDLLQRQIGQSYMIVDTLLGTGSTGAPREPMADAIRWANQADLWRVAIDLPTGLNADTGIAAEPTFRAHLTLTMVTQKLGFKNPQASEFLGDVRVLPIGIPASQLQSLLLG